MHSYTYMHAHACAWLLPRCVRDIAAATLRDSESSGMHRASPDGDTTRASQSRDCALYYRYSRGLHQLQLVRPRAQVACAAC